MRCILCGSDKVKQEHKWFITSEYSQTRIIQEAADFVESLGSCYTICTCENCGEVWVEASIRVVEGYNGGAK